MMNADCLVHLVISHSGHLDISSSKSLSHCPVGEQCMRDDIP
jgi:hypothetical protein